MPVYVFMVPGAVLLGGLLGKWLGGFISDEVKSTLSLTFGFCSISIGIVSLVHVKTLSALVLSVILGTLLGTLLKLDKIIQKIFEPICSSLLRGDDVAEQRSQLMAVMMIFCASGTGIFGAIQYGATGDGSILFAKVFLDFFTAVIFSSVLGVVVSVISVPQLAILLGLYLCGPFILRVSTPNALEDFTACGGFVMLVTGFQMIKLKAFPVVNTIPAFLLIIPISMLWSRLFM